MHMQSLGLRTLAFLTGLSLLGFSTFALADPPSRVARLGYTTGTVSFSPGGESDWVRATVNRPLGTGDRLWAEAGGRAEIQVGGAMIRMNAGTGVSVINLDDRITQLQLTQGVLNVRVRRLGPEQAFEIDTPNLAFTIRQPGEFRIEVDPDGDATTIYVRRGRGEVYGEGASYVIDSRQPYRFTGTNLSEYRYVDQLRADEFDRWSGDRDRRYDMSTSARYVSQDVIGYQDLDANGTWRADASYGNVWFPNQVATGWAPYRDGHWAWVDPWGWTWIDDAPWGFAVSHYGRWTSIRGAWGWVPGPVRSRAYYAPALVAFVGGDNFQLSISSGSVGGVAWFPLGPREVFRPSYPVSRGYFENVNRSNTIVNTTVINNYYNNTNVTNVVYANRQVPGAVIAVPTTVFAQSQPVSRSVVRVREDAIARASVAAVPAIAPTERSVRGAAGPGGAPPARAFEKPVVARSAPPAAPAGFAAQQPQLAAKPGKPLDDATRRQLKPSAAAPAPAVRVVAQEQKAPPTMAPPARQGDTKPSDARGKPGQRAPEQPRGQVAAPPTMAPPPMQGETKPSDARGKPGQRVTEQPRGQAAAPLPPPPVQREAKPVPRQAALPAPASAAPPQRLEQPQAAPAPRATPAAPAARQPEQRARPEPAPTARQVEPRPAAAQPSAGPPQAQPAPKPEPHVQASKPAAGKPDEKGKPDERGKDDDEPKQGEEGRKPKK